MNDRLLANDRGTTRSLAGVGMHDIALVAVGSVLVALTAQVELPFWPVPLTGQTFGVLLVAALLGRVRGTISVALYLGWGALGLPVFAGGAAGIARLMGPTGGYLLGFLAAAWVTGMLFDRGWASSLRTAVAAVALGTAAVFACGLPWLAAFIGWEQAVTLGLLPFLMNDIVKIIAVSAVARAVRGKQRG